MVTPNPSNSPSPRGLDCDARRGPRRRPALGGGDRQRGLRGPVRGPPAPARLCGARRPDARGDARAVDATLTPAQWAAQRTDKPDVDRLVIEGGRRSRGEVRVSGAKNAALPILCAALLAAEPLVLTNVPRLNDVRTMQTLLAQMGVALDTRDAGTVALDAGTIDWPLAPYELVKTMRASILVLGPLRRALRRGARVAAGRLRDRPAPRRPAPQGPRGDGRRDRPRARLHQRRARSGSPARASCSTSSPSPAPRT